MMMGYGVSPSNRDGVGGFPDEEGEKPDGLHDPQELVIGPQVPKIEHPLIGVLALARLEQQGDRVEEVVGPTRITGGRHRPLPSGACSPCMRRFEDLEAGAHVADVRP